MVVQLNQALTISNHLIIQKSRDSRTSMRNATLKNRDEYLELLISANTYTNLSKLKVYMMEENMWVLSISGKPLLNDSLRHFEGFDGVGDDGGFKSGYCIPIKRTDKRKKKKITICLDLQHSWVEETERKHTLG